MRLSRLYTKFRLFLAVLSDNTIVIQDKGERCRTFVGSGISQDRLRVLLINNLRVGQTEQTT